MPSQTLNGVQLSLKALQSSDDDAFKLLLSTMLKSGTDIGGFEHDDIVADVDDPNYATTNVSVAREKAHVSLWGYGDSQEIRYKRISLSTLTAWFGNIIYDDMPTTTNRLLAIYLTKLGLHDRSVQAVPGAVISVGQTSIEMQNGTFLLCGQANFDVRQKQRQLALVITDTILDGFRNLADFQTLSAEHFIFTQMKVDNAANLPYPLQFALMSVGTPEKISGYRYDNTKVTVTAFGEGAYLGNVDVTYTRYDFGWTHSGVQFLVDGPSIPTTQYMIDAIVSQTGFPITIDDVNVESYMAIPSGQVETLTITFKDSNLRYTGELTIDYRAA